MKKIAAYLPPFMLPKGTDGLHKIHIHGRSVWEIRGFAKEKKESYPRHSKDYAVEFTHKGKIEIICQDRDAEKIVEVTRENAHTGSKGDGKIFIYNSSEKAISIRTSEKGNKAI